MQKHDCKWKPALCPSIEINMKVNYESHPCQTDPPWNFIGDVFPVDVSHP